MAERTPEELDRQLLNFRGPVDWDARMEITRKNEEEENRRRALRPSLSSTPDEAGCWCLDAECKRWGHRYYERNEVHQEVTAIGQRFGDRVYCPCEVGQRQYAEAKLEAEAAHRRYTMILWERAEIPARFRNFRFATSPQKELAARLDWTQYQFEEDAETDEEAQRRGQLWENIPGSVLLWGSYGCGKTGLAVSLAFLHADSHEKVLFRSLPDLLSELRSTYGQKPKRTVEGYEDYSDDRPTEWQVIERYRDVDLLILDDLGAEQLTGSGWVEDRLYQIIGGRHADNKDTVFTSNLSPEELGRRIGERIMWRIVEMCGDHGIIHVTGDNQRAPKA